MSLLDPMQRKEGTKPFDPSFGSVCNTCHFFIGMAIVFGFCTFGISPIYGFIAVLCWTLPKDLWWDITQETTTWKDEEFDVAMYTTGGLVAMFSALVKQWLAS
jgi:hypothetical protein